MEKIPVNNEWMKGNTMHSQSEEGLALFPNLYVIIENYLSTNYSLLLAVFNCKVVTQNVCAAAIVVMHCPYHNTHSHV